MGPIPFGDGQLGLLILAVAIGGWAIGMAWIRRITRDPEGDPWFWRSHAAGRRRAMLVDHAALHPLEDGRGLRGRRTARFVLFAVLGVDTVVALLFFAMPGARGTMSDAPLFPVAFLVPAFGIALHVGGLAWMIHIVRADPEGGRSSWRAFRG
jgi:hypothetical protein